LHLVAAPAIAEDNRSAARERFVEGRSEFDAGRFERALELFKEAYALAPHPDLLFNIARCHEELHRWHDARDAYDRYLAVNPKDEEAQRRAAEVSTHLGEEPWPKLGAPPSPAPRVEPIAAPAPASATSATTATRARAVPLYRRWWLWTAVVGAAVIVAGGVALGVTLGRPTAQSTFPPLSAR
jgi:iron complex outermembrane receptor protein